MILINLLPHREAARKRRREAFYAALGVSALAGGVIAGGIYLWYAAQISNQQSKNPCCRPRSSGWKRRSRTSPTLQAEIAALRARQQAVEDLQADRNMPVHLLNELVKQLPDGVYVTSVKQENQIVSMQGIAQSNERVSELLRNLGNNSPWLTQAGAGRDHRRQRRALTPARPAPGRQLHDASQAAARQRGAESRRRAPPAAASAAASSPAAGASASAQRPDAMATTTRLRRSTVAGFQQALLVGSSAD